MGPEQGLALSEDSDSSCDVHEHEFNACTPLEHLEWASKLPPLSANLPTPLTSHQQSLLRELATSPDAVYDRVRSALQFWSARKESLRAINESYRSTLSPEELGTLGKLDLFLMNEMVLASEHVDVDYVKDLAAGFPVTGLCMTAD